MESEGGKEIMFSIDFFEENFEMLTTSIKLLDVLYESELDFDRCINLLNSLSKGFMIGKVAMGLDKEAIKELKDSMQKDVNNYKKTKGE